MMKRPFAAVCLPGLLALVSGMTLACPASAQSDFRALHGVDGDGYQAWFNQATGDGYRPIFVNGYDAGASVQFAAVAIQDANPPDWKARHNLSNDEFQQAFNDLNADGYRPISISGYLAGGSPRYAAVWVRDGSQARWELRHAMTSQEYQETVGNLQKQGLRPARISGYGDGQGSHRIAALFVEAGNTLWVARHDLTGDQYQQAFDEWTPKGYRPTSVSGYPTSAGVRFAVVLVKDASPWQARHDLTADEYQQEFDRQAENSFRPQSVSGYVAGGEVRYAAVWVQDH